MRRAFLLPTHLCKKERFANLIFHSGKTTGRNMWDSIGVITVLRWVDHSHLLQHLCLFCSWGARRDWLEIHSRRCIQTSTTLEPLLCMCWNRHANSDNGNCHLCTSACRSVLSLQPRSFVSRLCGMPSSQYCHGSLASLHISWIYCLLSNSWTGLVRIDWLTLTLCFLNLRHYMSEGCCMKYRTSMPSQAFSIKMRMLSQTCN